MRDFLIDTVVHLSPPRALEGLSAGEAERPAGETLHSVAAIVAHMDFWQRWFCARCEGADTPLPAAAAVGWPAVTPGGWLDVQRRFLDGLEHAARLSEDAAAMARPLTPAIAFPPMAGYTRRDALTHVAVHNAHHLGQIITLRQLTGAWPPPAGSWTW